MGTDKDSVKDTEDVKETDPALPDAKKTVKGGDQVTSVIGEVGRWHLEKILIVFLASAPGLCLISERFELANFIYLLIKAYLTSSMPDLSRQSRDSGALR